MSTLKAIALRQDEARRRIAEAAQVFADLTDVDVPDLTPRHRDTGIAHAMQLEAFAVLMESGNAALAKQRMAAEKAAKKATKKATKKGEPDGGSDSEPDGEPDGDTGGGVKDGDGD